MYDFKWSESEKKLARRVFDAALAADLAELLAEFKAKADAVMDVDDMWPLQEYLGRQRRAIDEKYDYRYSRLPLVFARLLREGRIIEADLAGLAEDKLASIRRAASVGAG